MKVKNFQTLNFQTKYSNVEKRLCELLANIGSHNPVTQIELGDWLDLIIVRRYSLLLLCLSVMFIGNIDNI